MESYNVIKQLASAMTSYNTYKIAHNLPRAQLIGSFEQITFWVLWVICSGINGPLLSSKAGNGAQRSSLLIV